MYTFRYFKENLFRKMKIVNYVHIRFYDQYCALE